jgi:aspartyl protease family protein
MFWWPVVIIALAILGVLLTGAPGGELAGQVDMRPAYLAVLFTALVLFAAGYALVRGGQRAMLNIAICLGTVAGLGTAFVFRDEAAVLITEIRAELMPSVAVSRAPGVEELRRAAFDEHYRAWAEVNGVALELMIDTGASMVLLPYEEAIAVGIDPEGLDFSVPVTTANGHSAVAPVQLSSIRIGKIAVFNVPAAVAQPEMLKSGLLGMSFLNRIDEVAFRDDRLILRQDPDSRSSLEAAGWR